MSRSIALPVGFGRIAAPTIPRSLLDRRPLLSMVLTAGTGAAAFLVVLVEGGAPSPLIQLAYVPIAIAAYRGGMAGGLLAAAIGALMMGPGLYLADLEGNGELGWPWILRGAMFLTIGGLLGGLFDRGRSATRAWRETAVEVVRNHQEGMEALARVAERKDPTTGDHMFRCRDLAGELGLAAGLTAPEAAEIAWSAMLHDVGKLYIPDHVLVKPSALDDEEWALMRLHPVHGAEILDHGATFEVARRIARWHHENLDGSGYPDGLRGGQIPLEARIVRIVDAWDAMTNDRPYRRALTVEQALEELHRYSGRWFDPDLVALFLRSAELRRHD